MFVTNDLVKQSLRNKVELQNQRSSRKSNKQESLLNIFVQVRSKGQHKG